MNVVISGTSSGLGLALAQKFLVGGSRVVGLSRSASALPPTEGYQHYQLDVADREAVQRAAQDCGFSEVDLLVNNAGLSGSGRRLQEVEPNELQELLDVNLFGSLNLVQAFLEGLKRSRGRIVNISSRFGSLTYNRQPENRGLAISYSYRISKAAQNMLAVCLANELEDVGIRLSTLHPGSFRSPCGRADATRDPDEVAQTIYDWLQAGQPFGELGLKEIGGQDYGW